uniref:Uncharacterized protein n=1 Tax=Crocodylus porosus TaxID=8502 RepID=A0A7M4FGF0_CROPO
KTSCANPPGHILYIFYFAISTYKTVMQMEYLDMVVNESVKLFPPSGWLERACKKTIVTNGATFPKGTVTMIQAYMLHHDPKLASFFISVFGSRFSKESRHTVDPYTFLPFGAGPRNCVGLGFDLLSLKVALVVHVENIAFRSCQDTQVRAHIDGWTIGLTGPKPIILKMVPKTRFSQKSKRQCSKGFYLIFLIPSSSYMRRGDI